MEDIIKSISQALDDKNYHAAMFIALSIPDICGAIENPDIKSNGIRARKWFTENLKHKYFPDNCYEHLLATDPESAKSMHPEQLEHLKMMPLNVKFEPELFWALRNAYLHEASDQAKATKVHITHSQSHMIAVKGGVLLSSIRFCSDMCEAAEEWLKKIQGDAEILQRVDSRAKIKNSIMENFLRVY